MKDIIVDVNYRSLPSIINNANSLIKHNQKRLDKNLVANRSGDEKVVYNTAKNEQEEAKYIVEQIKKLKDNGTALRDIAVLYRNHALSRSIEEVLISENIKYRIYSGIDFFQRKEIKDILSYLKFILYEKDIDFMRIINTPKRGFGTKKLEHLTEYANNHKCSLYDALKANIYDIDKSVQNGYKFVNLIEDLQMQINNVSVSELLNLVLDKSGYMKQLQDNNEEERLENLEELKHSIIEFEETDIEEKTLQEYLDKISLFTDSDRPKYENAVKLMTIHASKGLEFKNVFVLRLNEGILPSSRTKTKEALEEERRLCYVAITRAKDKLFLSDVQLDENNYSILPSRFLLELDKDDIEYANDEAKQRISKDATVSFAQEENCEFEFKVNDRVKHFLFGNGTIVDINYNDRFYIIKFDKFDTERTISIHIKLTRC